MANGLTFISHNGRLHVARTGSSYELGYVTQEQGSWSVYRTGVAMPDWGYESRDAAVAALINQHNQGESNV